MHKATLEYMTALPLSGIALTEKNIAPSRLTFVVQNIFARHPNSRVRNTAISQLQAMPSSCTTSEEPTDMHRYTMRGCTSAIEK